MTTDPIAINRQSRLVGAFVTMADTLVDDYDVADVLHQLVEYCVELLDATAAGLMLSDQQGQLRALAASTERARLLELFQLQANQGPCLDCFSTGEPVLVPDLSECTQRWPLFAREAIREGYRAVHAIPLRLRQETIGAMNLFHSKPGPLDTEDLQVARALADISTIGILHERAIRRSEVVTEQLQTALNDRVIIEQAKGMLAHSGDLEMHEAFDVLRKFCRGASMRLSDVAHKLVSGAMEPTEILGGRSVR